MQVNLLSSRIQILSNGSTFAFDGQDLIGVAQVTFPAPRQTTPTAFVVRLYLTGEAGRTVVESKLNLAQDGKANPWFDIDLSAVENQPDWPPSPKGVLQAVADITPLIRYTPSSSGGQVDTIVPGDAIDVDSTDPANPIVNVKVDGVTVTINGSNELEAAAGAGITSLTGPVTATGPGAAATTITPVIAAAGPIGSATVSAIITFNAAGQLTTVTSATITPAIGSITGLGANVATALANAVGSAGAVVVFNGAGGTPSSIVLTNATGLPVAGLAGLGTGVAAALAIAVGSAGAFVAFNGAGGTPSSITLTNGVSLPLSTGISGFGTGIATALAVNVGSAGAPVLFNGVLGTPSAGVATNLTGLPPSTGLESPYGAFMVASYNTGVPITLFGTGAALTNMTNAIAFLNATVIGVKMDLTGYVSVKFQMGCAGASASANTPKAILRYFTSYSTTTGDYLDIGTSEVSCSMSTAGMIETSWISLAAGAIGTNKFLRVLVQGGDGAADPIVGPFTAFFR